MKKGIYRLCFSAGRSGHLHGIFIATKTAVDDLVKSENVIHFGEVLGKHSEVYGPIDKGEITLVTNDKTAVDAFSKFKMETGYNPFNYLHQDEDE